MQADIDGAWRAFDVIRRRPAVAHWLAKLGEHDTQLLRHSLLVGAVASLFAFKAKLPDQERDAFLTGALLHDIGKITISPKLLHKPERLSTRERRELETHATRGFTALAAEAWENDVLELVHLHHERLDGSGYPNGFRGDRLSREVRMVALCDVFCAMIEERVYRPRPSRPLDILLSMTDRLDGELLGLFISEVAVLAYTAKDRIHNELAEISTAYAV